MSESVGCEIENVEHAYECLANHVLDFVASRPWVVCGVLAQVTPGAVTLCGNWLEWQGIRDEKAVGWGSKEVNKLAMEAVRFLREELLARTGGCIWGFAFTLYPNGKFHIEYDYNKPLGYEETDETISGEEINASLTNLLKREKTNE